MAKASPGNPSRRNDSTARSRQSSRGRVPAPPVEIQRQTGWQTFAVCLFLGVCVWAVFGQTLHHDFVNYDDDIYVYENAAITHGLSWGGVVWAFTHRLHMTWHPVTTLSHMLDCQLYELKPWGHHLTNVLLHVAAAMLLFGALKKLTGTFWRSALVAAIFAIHPLRVESVAWVSERKDVLSGVFFMLTLWAYARYAQKLKGETPNRLVAFCGAGSYWLALGMFALGLMSKPTLVALPLLLLLLDFWPLGRFTLEDARFKLGRLLWEKVPFLVLSAAACGITMLTQKEAIETAAAVEVPARIGNAILSYAIYLWQMVCPVGLAVPYPHPGNHLPHWQVMVSALVLLMVSITVFLARKKWPYGLVGWLWYLGMLVPVIGLVQVGDQAHADRYTYLPQIGLYILVVWGAVELSGKWRQGRIVLAFGAVAVLSGLLAAAYIQTGYWKNNLALWTHSLACTSGNWLAHNNLGRALEREGRLAEAVEHYRKALEINPDFAGAENNLGNALAGQGKVDEAIEHYHKAIQLQPDDAKAQNNLATALAGQGRLDEAIGHYQQALQFQPDYAEAHNNLAVALVSLGRLDEAIGHYQQALQLQPNYAEAHNNLAIALASKGGLEEAIGHYQRALQLEPDYAKAHNNLAAALYGQGKLDEAIQHYQRALQLESNYLEAHYGLGVVLVKQAKLDEAIQHFEKVLQLQPDYAGAHRNLGIALAENGKVAEAIGHYQEALRLATAQNNTAMAEDLRARLNALPSLSPKNPLP